MLCEGFVFVEGRSPEREGESGPTSTQNRSLPLYPSFAAPGMQSRHTPNQAPGPLLRGMVPGGLRDSPDRSVGS